MERYLPKIVYLDSDGFVQLVKTERGKEKIKRTTTPPKNSDSLQGDTSRLLKSLGADDFAKHEATDSQSQAKSLKIEQKV